MTEPARSSRWIRRLVFVPIGLALLGVLAVACAAILWQKHVSVQERLDARMALVEQLFQDKLEAEAELMQGLADSLERDARIQASWLARDRQKLLEYSRPRFEEIRSKFRVTHLYFHDLDKVCFLRAHNPPRFADTIDRHTLAEAVRTAEPTQGPELGPFGAFTLRVVRPWRIDGRLVGYIELGEEIGHIPPALSETLDARLYFAVDKSYLDRARWEEGLEMTGQTGQWELDDRFVFVGCTAQDLPPRIVNHLSSVQTSGTTRQFDFSDESGDYRCGVVPLTEASGRQVGKIIFLLNITRGVAAQNGLLTLLVGWGLALVVLLGAFFWSYLGWIQREVTQAQEVLEISLQREQSFVNDVAHELRTPLAGMRMTIDVALFRQRSAEELRESLDDCSPIVTNMESMVGKLLMLARLDGGRLKFHKETIELASLVDECWKPLQEQARTRKLTFENRVPSDLVCFSDSQGLAIILTNLLGNSVEYADRNGRIWVTVERTSKGAIRIEVANTGCQLTSDEMPMIFEQFWRADGSRDSQGRHAGLGLSLVRRLSRALGQDAWARVDDQQVFTVRVVLDDSPAA